MRHSNSRRLSPSNSARPEGETRARTGLASPEQRQMLREQALRIRYYRELRRDLFDPNLFGEPAWEILLALYSIDWDRRRLNTGELAKLADLALTTALRWLDYLVEKDLVARNPNPFDHRMVYVELSDKGRAAMDDYIMRLRGAELFRANAGG